jgi:hypothetical protein
MLRWVTGRDEECPTSRTPSSELRALLMDLPTWGSSLMTNSFHTSPSPRPKTRQESDTPYSPSPTKEKIVDVALTRGPYTIPLHNGASIELYNAQYKDQPAVGALIHGPRKVNGEEVNARGLVSLQTLEKQQGVLTSAINDIRQTMRNKNYERRQKHPLRHLPYYEEAYALWAADKRANWKLGETRDAWLALSNVIKREYIRLARTVGNFHKRDEVWKSAADVACDCDQIYSKAYWERASGRFVYDGGPYKVSPTLNEFVDNLVGRGPEPNETKTLEPWAENQRQIGLVKKGTKVYGIYKGAETIKKLEPHQIRGHNTTGQIFYVED